MFDDLITLQQQLMRLNSVSERNDALMRVPRVREHLRSSNGFARFVESAPPEIACALKQLLAIDQGLDVDEESLEKWRALARTSVEIDRFYREIGGIVGYQVSILQMLQNKEPSSSGHELYHSPTFYDLSEPTDEVAASIFAGLEALPRMAELYPLGGAADRLHLMDSETGLELPAAKLEFGGRPLLATLLRDLLAREWLYYALFGRQITTPVAIMTSYEKDNHRHVQAICEENGWFGRPRDSFRLFVQPLVPAVDERGNWHLMGSCRPLLKPGGHGAIWKLARDEGIFDWLQGLGCKSALVRQINNPIAGLDDGLVALMGTGVSHNMAFGFASCCRRVGSAEGVVVLQEKAGRIVLTNIEYCDFVQKGIVDEPVKPDLPYSRFSSNTNILFADLQAVKQAVDSHPFPGLLMNLKSAQWTDEAGVVREGMMARLESTMQNIADAFDEPKEDESLVTKRTFVTYNRRHKTISVAKKAYLPGKPWVETPEHCFYEMLQAARELLKQGAFLLPPSRSVEEYLENGPDCAFLYHPALGPFYSIIRQKLMRGSLGLGSELCLEIAEFCATDLFVEGSLRVVAERPLGPLDGEGRLCYSARVGQCILRNVRVQNLGVDWKASQPFWKMSLQRKESVEILLEGHSLFEAEDVVLRGAHRFVVKDGVHMKVRQKEDGSLVVVEEPLLGEGLWRYEWDGKGVVLGERRGKAAASPVVGASCLSSFVSESKTG